MSPPTPDPDSPFAEFARPKESAVEQFLQRKLQDRKSSVARRQFLAFTLAGSALAASIGAGIGASPATLPAALGLAVPGALLGIVVGGLVGSIVWALKLRGGGVAGMVLAYYEREMVTRRGNSWDQLGNWLRAWVAIGIVCGAAFGAAAGARLMAGANGEEMMPWTMSGSTLGFAIGVGLWFARQRLRGKMKADETEP